MFNVIAIALASLASPMFTSYYYADEDNALTIEATLRIEALYRGVSAEKGLNRVSKITTFHAQAMTVFHLLYPQFRDEKRKREFAIHFDKLIHSYKFV